MKQLDPNESNPAVLWAEIARLQAAVAGPDGYATWQEAATAERVRRVRAAAALTKAARDVLAERKRQIEAEGWTPDHDDEHKGGGMAFAAAAYAVHADAGPALTGTLWRWTGWALKWLKPKDRRSNLVRAGALILAELERLDRAEACRQAMHICSSCEHPDRCRNDGCYEK